MKQDCDCSYLNASIASLPKNFHAKYRVSILQPRSIAQSNRCLMSIRLKQWGGVSEEPPQRIVRLSL